LKARELEPTENAFTFILVFARTRQTISTQPTEEKLGRREGVKGVTVSRGPDLKKEPGNHESKIEIE
jgi:hypothetical protein